MSGKVQTADAGEAAAPFATTAGRASRSRHDLIAAVITREPEPATIEK
jgi:hypothetical protein